MNKLIKFLILPFILLSLFSCSSKELTSIDLEAITQQVNTYLSTDDVEILYSWRNENIEVSYVIVSSSKIDKTDRVDTIIDENLNRYFYVDYYENEQLFAIKNNKVYSIKEAYCDLVIDQDELEYITAVNNDDYRMGNPKDKPGLYTRYENGEVLKHETKKFRGNTTFYNGISQYRTTLMVLVDYAFYNHEFTTDDFSFIGATKVEKGLFGNPEHFDDIDTCENNGTPHHHYSITLKDTSKENLIRSIFALRNCYFVYLADMEAPRVVCN